MLGIKQDFRGGADSRMREAFDPEASGFSYSARWEKTSLSLVAAVLGWGLGKPPGRGV